MRNIKILILAVVLSIAALLTKHVFIWAATPLTGTSSFDFFMSGVFAVFGLFFLAFLIILLVYSILEKPAQNTTTVETPVEITTVHTAPVLSSTDAYIARQNARTEEYIKRQNARTEEYLMRRQMEIDAYHARRTAEIASYREFRQL